MGTPFQVTIPESENDIDEIRKRWLAESKHHGDFMKRVRQAIREFDKQLKQEQQMKAEAERQKLAEQWPKADNLPINGQAGEY